MADWDVKFKGQPLNKRSQFQVKQSSRKGVANIDKTFTRNEF